MRFRLDFKYRSAKSNEIRSTYKQFLWQFLKINWQHFELIWHIIFHVTLCFHGNNILTRLLAVRLFSWGQSTAIVPKQARSHKVAVPSRALPSRPNPSRRSRPNFISSVLLSREKRTASSLYFDRHVFQNFNLSYFTIKQKLSCSIFKYLDRFMVFLFVLITFEPVLDGFLRFSTNPEIQDGGPRWAPLRNDFAIITTCDVITSWWDFKGNIFRYTIYPPNLVVMAFISRSYEVGGGGGGKESASPPVVEDQNKPGVNRVNNPLNLANLICDWHHLLKKHPRLESPQSNGENFLPFNRRTIHLSLSTGSLVWLCSLSDSQWTRKLIFPDCACEQSIFFLQLVSVLGVVCPQTFYFFLRRSYEILRDPTPLRSQSDVPRLIIFVCALDDLLRK